MLWFCSDCQASALVAVLFMGKLKIKHHGFLEARFSDKAIFFWMDSLYDGEDVVPLAFFHMAHHGTRWLCWMICHLY